MIHYIPLWYNIIYITIHNHNISQLLTRLNPTALALQLWLWPRGTCQMLTTGELQVVPRVGIAKLLVDTHPMTIEFTVNNNIYIYIHIYIHIYIYKLSGGIHQLITGGTTLCESTGKLLGCIMLGKWFLKTLFLHTQCLLKSQVANWKVTI